MNLQIKRLSLAFANAAIIAVAGCGGGGGESPSVAPLPAASTPPPASNTPAAPTTTDVSTTVIDGAVKNALVCMDKNSNGKCDADEPQGKTDVAGNVTIAVPNADVGKYPILALVGTDAVDADHGTVTVPYSMSAPAGKPSVVSPLTTMVQETIASSGVTIAEAEKTVQNATGITVSLFQDFTKVAAPTDGSPDAKTVARMVVVTTQEQNKNLTGAVGTKAIDDQVISQQDLNKAIQKKLLEILPKLIEALTNPAYLAASTPKAKEAAIVAAVSSSLLTTASVPTFVAINNQAATTAAANTITVAPIIANASLSGLSYSNSATWSIRTMVASAAQNTPAVGGLVRYVERRLRSNNGVTAAWGMGSEPSRNADLHWNGSAWTGCALNYENTSTLRDAAGNSSYEYCNKLETGKSSRASFDVTGKTMLSVYNQIVSSGYTNITIANAATVLGTTTFPAGSNLFYQTTTPLSEAISYYPGGGNVVKSYSAAVYGGGDARAPSTSVGCSSVEFQNAPALDTTTLEAMVSANPGTPCLFNTSTLTVGSVTYSSGDSPSEAWGNSSISIGTLGTVNQNGTANAFYTGNTLIRLAFKGTGTNPVTYYACKQRFGGSPRNCRVIGSGNYTITTYGDGRAMTLSNPPIEAAPLTYNRVFVERAGKIYFGYQSKLNVSNTARLNLVGINALMAKLGMPTVNPEAPLALTAASYQGTYDSTVPSLVGGSPQIITINGDGTVSCFDKTSNSGFVCSLNSTDPVTGAFTFTGTNSIVTTGITNFMTGVSSGSFSDPSTNPPTIRTVSSIRR